MVIGQKGEIRLPRPIRPLAPPRRLACLIAGVGILAAVACSVPPPAVTTLPATATAAPTPTPSFPTATATALPVSATPTASLTTPTLAGAGSPSPIVTPTPATRAACAPGVDLLGFSDGLDKTRFAETAVGGLSALAYHPTDDTYLALVDNERETPARLYTLRLPLDDGRLGTPQVEAVTLLRDTAGRSYTGRTLDGEGLARLPGGDLLVASETEPSLRRFGADGRQRAELPVPSRFAVAPRGEATANATFEGLALTPNGRTLYVAMEGPLDSDSFAPELRARLRLLRYDTTGDGDFTPTAQHFYLAEPAQAIAALAAPDNTTLLVLERGFLPGVGNTIRIFQVDLANASDVSAQPRLGEPGLTPLPKHLLVDLARCPAGAARHPGPQPNPLLDNFEALALGPTLPDGRQALLLVSDDNFSASQVTRVLALAIRL